MLESELSERHRKFVELNLKIARFPYMKRLKEFDFSVQPSIDRRIVAELATGRFFQEGRNVVFLGPPGVGKTHLAIALEFITAEMGHRVYFTTTVDQAHKLSKAVDQNRLHRQIMALMQPKLLILEQFGYLTFDPPQASLPFQVICQRYQRGQSIALTSNKAFSDWGHIFSDDPVMAFAALDRLLHSSTVINIKDEFYRLKEKRKAGSLPLTLSQEMPMN